MKEDKYLKSINDLQTAILNIGDDIKVLKNMIQAQQRSLIKLNDQSVKHENMINTMWSERK